MKTSKKLKKVMNIDLIIINENDKYPSFESQFQRKRIHHLLVENDENELVGIISSHDTRPIIRNLDKEKILAKHLMTTDPFVLAKKDTVAEALELFMDNVIRAIPFVDKEEKLVGIVTPYDLMQLIH